MLARHRDTRGKPMKTAIVTGGFAAASEQLSFRRFWAAATTWSQLAKHHQSRAFEAFRQTRLDRGSIADRCKAEEIAEPPRADFDRSTRSSTTAVHLLTSTSPDYTIDDLRFSRVGQHRRFSSL